MAQLLNCSEDAKYPCAALTGGEMNPEELFGDAYEEDCITAPPPRPRKKGDIPVEMIPDPSGPCMIPVCQREYRRERIVCAPAYRIKTAVAVSPTLLRYRPAAA